MLKMCWFIVCIFILTSTGTVAGFGDDCSAQEPNNTTTECISQCITSLYKLQDCAGYKKVKNLTDIITNRHETMPALIPNEYSNIKGQLVSVVSNCDIQKGIKVYRRPNALIAFMNIAQDIEQSNSELNHQTLRDMIKLFEQFKSNFNHTDRWCVHSLGLEEQMKQIKRKTNTSLELDVTIVDTSGETTEHEPLNFTHVIETHRIHPREHYYTRSVWLILFISMLLMAILIAMSIFLRVCLSKHTQQPVQPESMLNLIE